MPFTMNKVIFVIMAIMTITIVSENKGENIIEWHENRTFCGSFLTDVLRVVCNGTNYRLNPLPQSPRTSNRMKRIPKEHFDECCNKTCTAQYLKDSHCADTSKDMRPYIVMPNKYKFVPSTVSNSTTVITSKNVSTPTNVTAVSTPTTVSASTAASTSTTTKTVSTSTIDTTGSKYKTENQFSTCLDTILFPLLKAAQGVINK